MSYPSKHPLLFLFLGIALLLFSLYLNSTGEKETLSSANYSLQQKLESEQAALKTQLEELNASIKQLGSSRAFEELRNVSKETSLSLFLLVEDQLTFWTEDESPVQMDELEKDPGIVSTTSSIYLLNRLEWGDTTLLALKELARSYPYQNDYLQTRIEADWLPFIEELQPYMDARYWNEIPVKNLKAESVSINRKILSSFLLLLALALLILSIGALLRSFPLIKSIWYIISSCLSAAYLLLLDPLSWKISSYFDPSLFSLSSFLPNAPSLLLFSICLIVIAYQLLLMTKHASFSQLFYPLILLSLFLAFSFSQLIQLSVSNSQFSFALENLFELSGLSYFTILAFGLCLLAILLIIKAAVVQFLQLPSKWMGLGFLLLSFLTGFFIFETELWLQSTILVLGSLGIYLLYQFKFLQIPFLYPFFTLLIFAIIVSLSIENQLDDREKDNRELLLLKLAEEKDPLLEYLFQNVQKEISSDEKLLKLAEDRWEQRDQYEDYLRENYFNGYWDRYNTNFILCQPEDSVLIGGSNQNQNCFDYYASRIYSEGEQISSNNLFQLSNLAGRIDYIGEIPLGENLEYRLFVELSRDYFSEELGYPELFLNQEDKLLHEKLNDYSYAVYYQGNLINSEGSFVYGSNPSHGEIGSSTFYTYETEEYEHTEFRKNENISIVLSNPKTELIDLLSRTTYLLILFGLLFFFFSLSLREFPYFHSFTLTDFSTKIRLLVAGTLLTALLLFIGGNYYYIKKQYQLKNADAIEEKLRSIRLELDQKIGGNATLDESMKLYVTSLLIKFSNVFYTDINFYSEDGKLYASSRPELFQQQIKSERMHPNAFVKMVKEQKSKLVQEESIGKLGFQSAYIPFKNRQNELLAYLNVPYFARQEELEEEISAFLVPTINIYVIIFIISFLISFLLINQISKPLMMIRSYLSRLKLDGSVELIEWQSEDEIGQLVREYNRIALELGQSAEELAKSERESAWREMAKQIAHEIKNPLTPMKLNIQHLQRAAQQEGESDELNQRINRTSETLISQIDSLNAIAEAFSSFAKFPEKELKAVDLLKLAEEARHLYIDQAETEIDNQSGSDSVMILADRDLILRLLNNLLKNAVQANESEKKAKIELKLELVDEGNQMVRLTIMDHGPGISEEQITHIFEPSFTTKSSGTGLGLAIVSRIMEQLGGSIEVKSKLGEGASFILLFPKA